MGWSIPILRVAGIQLRIHITFLLLIAWIAFAYYAQGGSPAAIGGVLFILLLFACVVLHEFGHALAGKAFGINTPDITLLPIGGVARLERIPDEPVQELVIAAAGPAVTALIALGAFIGGGSWDYPPTTKTSIPDVLFTMNVVLLLFNLLPAFPMDGGRIVRALLTERYGPIRATQIAVGLGKIFAVLFGIFGLFSFNIILIVIAFFIFVGADAESRGVLVKAMLGHVRVRDLMSPSHGLVSPAMSVYDAAEQMLRERRLAYPVLENGRVVGLLAEPAVGRVPPNERRLTPVSKVMRDVETVAPDDDLGRALQAMGSRDVPMLPVVQDGAMIGVLLRSDVMRGLRLQELEASQKLTSSWRGPDKQIEVGA